MTSPSTGPISRCYSEKWKDTEAKTLLLRCQGGGGAKGKEEKELEDHTGDTPESKFAHTKHELRMDTRVVSMI